jgi:hypothetical protein
MAKFSMVVTKPEERLQNGTVIPAFTQLIPLDDAAKVTPQARDAMASGVWTPKDPAERSKAAMRLATAHANEDVRRGVVAKDDHAARVTELLRVVYPV